MIPCPGDDKSEDVPKMGCLCSYRDNERCDVCSPPINERDALMNNNFFLTEMKRYSDATIWGYPFKVFDFYTSTTPDLVIPDVEKDFYDVRLLHAPMHILDIGANVGLWSLAVARKFPACTVYAVEAAPWNVQNLKQNLEYNQITNVRVIEAVLGEKDGDPLVLYQHPLNSGGCSIRNPDVFPKVEAKAKSLGTLIRELGSPVFDFVKVDIEGSEYDMFKGFNRDSPELWDNIKLMGIELHGYQDSRESTEKEKEDLYQAIISKISPEKVCAISHTKSYKYGKEIAWGSVQAKEEADAKTAAENALTGQLI